MNPDRVLFLDTYTDPTFSSISSAEIGYGISCATALKSGLRRLNLPVIDCSPLVSPEQSKLEWIYSCYKSLHTLRPTSSDIIFVFNSLIHFPGELRRLVNHHTRSGCPIIGYTHGSHWDPTDAIRHSSNPKLIFQDLANLLTYDRLLLVTEYYRRLLRDQLTPLGPQIIRRFDEVARVVGLPVDTDTMDTFSQFAASRDGRREGAAIVFNHALRETKRPNLAFEVLERVLSSCANCSVQLTRSIPNGTDVELQFKRLSQRFNDRILCHHTLSLDRYYRLLWESDIQFSTASHESFGVATVEAMYTGNACFTPHALSYPEVTGGVGNYFDTNELISLLEKAISSWEFRRATRQAQQTAAARFKPDVIARNIYQVIEGLDG